MARFYITTTLPYVNAEPHIGFALETVQADAIARYHRMMGDEVVFNTGTDEHGLKIYRKALESGSDPQAYVDEYAARFVALKSALDLSYTNFIRTTDPHHMQAAEEFWSRCLANGAVYKKDYKIKYCVGCELEKTDSELVGGHCILHPNLIIEEISEENYFFRFSAFQEKLLRLYEEHPDFVLPESRFREIKSFVAQGLQDFSISRLKEKLPWGVPVPGDSDQVMYVWFDALVNYISTLGWPENMKTFSEYWPGTQIAGKDNLRQQSAIWQAMLMAAGLPTSQQILIHGFVTVDGQKMSKSLGNVADPVEIVKEYGTDVLRYVLLREFPSGEDGDFTLQNLHTRYNSDLANGLGNLVQRVSALILKSSEKIVYKANLSPTGTSDSNIFDDELYHEAFKQFRLHDAVANVWSKIADANAFINDHAPWKQEGDARRDTLAQVVAMIAHIAWLLQPFMPGTAQAVAQRFGVPLTQRIEDGMTIAVTQDVALFPRKD